MKFFSVFAAIVAVAFASPADWSLSELSAAIQDPNTPVALRPILEDALNQMMHETFTGGVQSTTTVSTAVQDFSLWTLYELSEALQNPATDPELAIYLEHALNSMMEDLMAGHQPEFVIVGTPIGVLPVVVAPAPVESVVVPAPVESVVAPSSPLVQIIVNIKSQQEAAPITPVPVILPEPVLPEVVLPQPVVLPPPTLPEVVIPEPVVLPAPVLPEVVLPQPVVLPPPSLPEVVIPEPVVLPAPVAPEVQVPINPVDVIAVNPVVVAPLPVVLPAPVAPEVQVPVNPVDIIAINPEGAFNPVDVIAVNPIQAGVGVVGPLV